MPEIYLNEIAHGRSGDKGDTSNVCVYAREPKYYDIIRREVTVEKVREYYGDMVKGEITRYETRARRRRHPLSSPGYSGKVDGLGLYAHEGTR